MFNSNQNPKKRTIIIPLHPKQMEETLPSRQSSHWFQVPLLNQPTHLSPEALTAQAVALYKSLNLVDRCRFVLLIDAYKKDTSLMMDSILLLLSQKLIGS